MIIICLFSTVNVLMYKEAKPFSFCFSFAKCFTLFLDKENLHTMLWKHECFVVDSYVFARCSVLHASKICYLISYTDRNMVMIEAGEDDEDEDDGGSGDDYSDDDGYDVDDADGK